MGNNRLIFMASICTLSGNKKYSYMSQSMGKNKRLDGGHFETYLFLDAPGNGWVCLRHTPIYVRRISRLFGMKVLRRGIRSFGKRAPPLFGKHKSRGPGAAGRVCLLPKERKPDLGGRVHPSRLREFKITTPKHTDHCLPEPVQVMTANKHITGKTALFI